MAQKHVAFAPASQKQLGSRLRSPLLPSRNHARSAFLTVFLPYSLRLASKKWGLAPFFAREPDRVGRRVCLSGASYAAAEKNEWRMALKI
ncbi:MAG: hypothetical protein GTO16_07090 [Candidatus Aminicenantes bacterium]|nr:hypothetical protein [Candidatus Aminicenantes bacterium]